VEEKLLTCKELAAKLQVKPGTIRLWTQQGRLPVVRIGRTVRFKLADVIKAGSVAPTTNSDELNGDQP